ncbi:hypothetical protein COR50_17180 [Chitinophaga caeni]|uniref:Uncharacterized protein n=1 Tax=Chitinophaga caeni TaxID=2029983 RepID=A0A291QXT4_9BACT|nr:hypothetical protein COR50_17180 [Chitinophaga caeni]
MEYQLRMICSTYGVAPPKKTRMLRTVDSERKPGVTVIQKLHRAIKLAAVMPICALFWYSYV